MKKLLILSALLIFGCSGDNSNDNNNSGTTDNSFNPPNWIQGVWLSEANTLIGFEFRADDICTIIGSQATCNKALIELYENVPGEQTNVYEEISDTRYFVVFTVVPSEQTYEFEKISANEINAIQVPNSFTTAIYTKQ